MEHEPMSAEAQFRVDVRTMAGSDVTLSTQRAAMYGGPGQHAARRAWPWINDRPIGPEKVPYRCGGNDRLRTLMGST